MIVEKQYGKGYALDNLFETYVIENDYKETKDSVNVLWYLLAAMSLSVFGALIIVMGLFI